MKGGAPIASGSSGTAFKPVIDCKDKEGRISKEEKHKYISKVMYPDIFEEEKKIIEKLKPIITEIPNNDKYFIINSIKLCENPIFSKDNLVSFNNKHSNGTYKFGSLKKKPVLTTNNLLVKDTFPYFGNKSNKVKVLQIPYGGQDIYKFLEANKKLTKPDIIRLNIGVINLIKNGIKPMNEEGLVHADLRIDNTVYDPETGLVKIIDWGLAYHKSFIISEDFFHGYGHPSKGYPIYCLLFFKWFIKLINNEIEIKGIPGMSTDKEDIISIGVNKIINFLFSEYVDIKKLPENIPRKIYDRSKKVINHLLEIYKYYGLTNDDLKNHIRSQLEIIIKNFFITTTSGPEDSENNSGASEWVNYNTFNFSPDRRERFRDTVYLKNIDLYTFIRDYLNVLIIYSELNIFKSDLVLEKAIKKKIKYIMLKYFFNPEEKYLTEGIDVEDLINDLKSINEILGHPKNSLNQPKPTILLNPNKKKSQITNSYCTKAMKAAGFCVGAIGAATVGFLGTALLQAYVGGGTKKKKLVKKNKRKVSKKKNKSKTNKISKRNKKKCVKQTNSKKKV